MPESSVAMLSSLPMRRTASLREPPSAASAGTATTATTAAAGAGAGTGTPPTAAAPPKSTPPSPSTRKKGVGWFIGADDTAATAEQKRVWVLKQRGALYRERHASKTLQDDWESILDAEEFGDDPDASSASASASVSAGGSGGAGRHGHHRAAATAIVLPPLPSPPPPLRVRMGMGMLSVRLLAADHLEVLIPPTHPPTTHPPLFLSISSPVSRLSPAPLSGAPRAALLPAGAQRPAALRPRRGAAPLHRP